METTGRSTERIAELFEALGGTVTGGFPAIHSPVYHTSAGTAYLKAPGVVMLAKPQTNVAGLKGFLEGFDPSLGFPAYLDDPTKLPDSSQLCKTAGQVCFDDETEILTDEGWKKFQDLNRTESVLTLDPETGDAEFQKPTAYQVHDYDGDLLSCEGKALSFAVTPDHRQWARLRGKSEYAFYPTGEIKGKRFAVRTAPLGWEGKIPEQISIPGFEYEQRISNQYGGSYGSVTKVSPARVMKSVEEIRALALLCVYYAAEGSLRRTPGEGLTIYGDHYSEVASLAETLGLKTNRWRDPRNGVLRTHVGGGAAIKDFFERECGDGCAHKRLPRWVLNLPANLLTDVWDTLVRTDGYRSSDGREYFVTTSLKFAGQAQEILCKLGFSSSLMQHKTPEGRLQVFVVSKKRRTEALANKNARVEKKSYVGKVYCVTTENGIVFVRRDGKPHFSGNCYASFGPRRTTNENAAQYFERLTSAGHGSVLEHANFSFLLYGISRSMTHELVRHRHLGFSQISQRYVSGSVLRFVERPEYQSDPELHRLFEDRADRAAVEYEAMAGRLLERQEKGVALLDADYKTDARKKVQQTARSLLPNETEASMVCTGNVRALRHVIEMRADEHAESEIRALAVRLFLCLVTADPILFGDYQLRTLPDGTYKVTTEYRKA